MGVATNRKVIVSAGEASGDAYGAAFVEELLRLDPGITIEAVGGKRLAATGIKLIADSAKWGVMGIVQGVLVGPRVLGGYFRAKARISRSTPGVFVPIDFGFANVKLARHAKSRGWKVLYFIPPGSWRRNKQGADLPKITDAISTPFEYSARILNEMGANAHWFGHPIKQLIADQTDKVERGNRIAILPGSRDQEIEHNLPIIARSIEDPVEFAMAPSIDAEVLKARWHALAGNRRDDVFTHGDVYGVLRRCKAAVVCSGTATLEAALCRCPMVVIYRPAPSMELQAKILGIKRPKFVALPNIIMDREIVPELIQENATEEKLRSTLKAVLEDPSVQLRSFAELSVALGPGDAITQTAILAKSLLDKISVKS